MRIPFPLLFVCLADCSAVSASSREDAEREHLVCTPAPNYPLELFEPRSVVSVAPLVSVRNTRGSQETQVLGARLMLRPISGLNAQELERILACHALRIQLQREGEPVVANDPYSLRDGVARITVESEQGLIVVNVFGRDSAAAVAILRRARAFTKVKSD